MEKKQLNFSAPLISARRYSSPLRSSGGGDGAREAGPTEQPETNMGEVVKPGSVPFVWEQIPGRAKSSNGSGSGSGSSLAQSPKEVPSTPKLPPAFLSSGRKSGELSGFRTPTKFLSGELGIMKPPTARNNNSRLSGELNTIPRLQSKFLSGELHTLNRPHTKLSGELGILSKYHSSFNYTSEADPTSESDNDDDANTFSDAHETFSNLESSSVNCSVSGLSSLAQPDTKPHPQPEPTVQGSVEPRTRELMMNRFLPAAKAMTLEPSQYASSRKQLAVIDQPKVVPVPRARTPPPGGRNLCHIVPYTGQDIGTEESEDDDEDEEERGCEEKSAISVKIKACGFLPWFCSKNSIRLLNPLPAMKTRSRSALSSASKVGNLVKNGSWKSSSPKLPKHVPCVNHKNKVGPAFKSCELQKPPKYTSRPMFYSGELQTTRTGSPYRNSSRRSSSPYRTDSPHHNNNNLYQRGVGILSTPKRVSPYDENRSTKSGPIRDASSRRFDHHQLRKNGETMYIDSVNIAKVSHSILNLPKTNRRQQVDNHEIGDLNRSGRLEIMKARGMSGPLLVQRANNNYSSELTAASNRTNTCRELVVVRGGDGDDRGGQSPLINPPLPKSPSESWLSRKLPSVSPRNSVSYSKVQSSRNNQNAKWENIVKSSHLRHDLGRYSEELVTHVPQRQQTWK